MSRLKAEMDGYGNSRLTAAVHQNLTPAISEMASSVVNFSTISSKLASAKLDNFVPFPLCAAILKGLNNGDSKGGEREEKFSLKSVS